MNKNKDRTGINLIMGKALDISKRTNLKSPFIVFKSTLISEYFSTIHFIILIQVVTEKKSFSICMDMSSKYTTNVTLRCEGSFHNIMIINYLLCYGKISGKRSLRSQ